MSRVVVVGGGIVGTSVAASLAGDHDLTLLERDALGSGATADSMAVFTRSRLSPTRVGQRLRDLSWAAYEGAVESGTVEFAETGSLRIAESAAERGRYERAVARLREFGVAARVLDGAAIRERGPGVEGPGLFVPADGHLAQGEVVEHYADRAREAGAAIETGVTVEGMLADGERIAGVVTDAGEYGADAVVNATGPWAPALNAAAGVDLPIRRMRGPIVELATDARSIPFTLFADALYVRRSPWGYYVGEYNTAFDSEADVDPSGRGSVGPGFVRRARDRLRRTVGVDDAALVDEWVGLRTVTPDGRPVVGATERPGFHVASGMNGLGVTFAPAVGELFARAFEGEDDDLATELSPRRF